MRKLHETGALVFKGGTALRKLYAGNQGRFSLDLDFSLAIPADPEAVVLELVGAIDGTNIGPFAHGVSERRGKWSLTVTSPFGEGDAILSSKLEFDLDDIGALAVPVPTEAELANTVSNRYAFLADLNAEERQPAQAREQDRGLALDLLAKLPGARLAHVGLY